MSRNPLADYVPCNFYAFCDPLEVYQYTRPTENPAADIDFILKKKKLIEASAAARLALCLNVLYSQKISMRLIPEQADHDFELNWRDEIMQFQFTECLEEGRKRDAEYRDLKMGKIISRPYRPSRNRENAIRWIIEAIKKKQKYSDKPNLLIYVNFNAYGLAFDFLSREVGMIKNLSAFSSVWVLLTSSQNFDETSLGRLFPSPQGWWVFDCAKGTQISEG